MYMVINLLSNAAAASGTTAASGTPAANPLGGWTSYIFLGGILVLMYFLLIRPQRKRQKEEQAVRDSLQVGDEIITIGGLSGKVVSIKDDSFVLETGSDKNKIRMMKWAIQENLTAPKPEKQPLFGRKKKTEDDSAK